MRLSNNTPVEVGVVPPCNTLSTSLSLFHRLKRVEEAVGPQLTVGVAVCEQFVHCLYRTAKTLLECEMTLIVNKDYSCGPWCIKLYKLSV